MTKQELVCPENAIFRFMFCDIAECCSVTLHAHGERRGDGDVSKWSLN